MQFPIAFPPPPGNADPPVWTGEAFRVGTREERVLRYHEPAGGWSDELTEFHEEAAGENHYIDKASREHALSRLQRWVGRPDAVVIDIGCSSGFLLKEARRRLHQARLIGADTVAAPLQRLAEELPGIPLLQFDLLRCPLPDGCLDAAVLLNVLEHVEDDLGALRQVFRILRPGGAAIIEVPAGPGLFDMYDELLHHYRRYRMSELMQRAKAAGFVIREKSHLGFLLYPPFWFVKKRNRRLPPAGIERQRELVARQIQTAGNSPSLDLLMKFEGWLRRFFYLPAGIRCLVVLERPR